MKRQAYIYELRNPDGTVAERGTAKELQNRCFYRVETLAADAKFGRLLDGRYRVVRVGTQDAEPYKTSDKSVRILEYIKRGMKNVEIAERMGMSRKAVESQKQRLKARGLIE